MLLTWTKDSRERIAKTPSEVFSIIKPVKEMVLKKYMYLPVVKKVESRSSEDVAPSNDMHTEALEEGVSLVDCFLRQP